MASLPQAVAVDTVGLTNTDNDNISTQTPDHRFRVRPLRNNSAESSLDAPPASPNRVFVHPCSHNHSANCPNALPIAPPLEPLESSSRLASPSGLANIRIRRSHHGSLLLQSPARAGHAARMRQIFEDASREQQTPQSVHLLYPQLPNTSRKTTLSLAQHGHVHNHSQQASPTRLPQPISMSTTLFRPGRRHTRASCAAASEQSSESWSDDSEYLITGSRNPRFTRAVVPDDRIVKWLTGVSTPHCDEPNAKVHQYDTHVRPEFCQRPPSHLSETISGIAKEPLESHSANTIAIQHVFINKDHICSTNDSLPSKPLSSLKKLLAGHPSAESTSPPTTPIRPHRNAPNHRVLSSDSDIQLSPLSPNVCIERGPSRHHSSRNLQRTNHASPTKTFYTPSKENTAPADPNHAQGSGHPETPCKVGMGTRFQHPEHTFGNRPGRWTRHVGSRED